MSGFALMVRGGVSAGRRSLPRASRALPDTHYVLGSHRAMSSDAPTTTGGALEDERVLEHLVCPISKYPLRYDRERSRLVCDEINVAYPIRNGVAVLVPAEGRILNTDSDRQPVE